MGLQLAIRKTLATCPPAEVCQIFMGGRDTMAVVALNAQDFLCICKGLFYLSLAYSVWTNT